MTEAAPPEAEPPERPSSRHITALDGYRGLAFLAVFARHYSLTSHAAGWLMKVAAVLGQIGWIGVDLFFVLSGFLITGILLDTRTDPHYFRNFIARRALRIFPLYYGVLFTVLALTPLLHLQWQRGQILYFFYLGNVAGNYNNLLGNLPPYISFVHLWSLSLEEQFYLLWPVAVYLAATPRRVLRLCLGLSLLGLLGRLALLHVLPPVAAYEWAYGELPTRMDGLLYGAVTAVLVRQMPMPRLAQYARPVFAASTLGLAAMFALIGGNFAYTPTTIFGYPLLALCFSSLLILAMQPGSMASHIGSLGPLRVMGRYSYGMYMYHLIAWPALGLLLPVLQARTHSLVVGGVFYVVLAFLITLVAAVASFELFERHFLRFKRHFHYARAERS